MTLSPYRTTHKSTRSIVMTLSTIRASLILVTTLALLLVSSTRAIRTLSLNPVSEYNQAPIYSNGDQCEDPKHETAQTHIAMTLDSKYTRGTIASVHSILKHAACPDNIRLHFIAAAAPPPELTDIIKSSFPTLSFKIHPFKNEAKIKKLISSSIRPALEDPLNYARIYLPSILDDGVKRVVYLDSDTVVVDDIRKLYTTTLTNSRVVGAPVYCHANFSSYFNDRFWSDRALSSVFEGRRACYFNTGVMVMDLERWRERERGGEREYTKEIEGWMEVQRERRIYELGSLPPLMLVFGGEVEGVDHRWNQHGLGGDNVENSCRSLHPGPVSLMHWSGKGKPWVRLDAGRACPLDHLWAPYDLYKFLKHAF